MTEDQIERRCERMMDTLDRAFLRGNLTQAGYDDAVRQLNDWADRQYDNRNPND